MHILHLLLVPAATVLAATTIVSTITESSTSSPTVAASSTFTNATLFQDTVLQTHNFYRAEHNTSALVWNASIAINASDWATGCVFQHSGKQWGENLVAGYPNTTSSIEAWGLERLSYNWNSPGFSESTGHFTQLVWSNTTSVGCGIKSCQGANKTPGWYIVCEYWPRGNIVGSGKDTGVYFRDNVKKQTEGGKKDTVESGVTSAGEKKGPSTRVWWALFGGLGTMALVM